MELISDLFSSAVDDGRLKNKQVSEIGSLSISKVTDIPSAAKENTAWLPPFLVDSAHLVGMKMYFWREISQRQTNILTTFELFPEKSPGRFRNLLVDKFWIFSGRQKQPRCFASKLFMALSLIPERRTHWDSVTISNVSSDVRKTQNFHQVKEIFGIF